jgi:hypothetical protein
MDEYLSCPWSWAGRGLRRIIECVCAWMVARMDDDADEI